jgi:hypothetical protein
MIQLVPLSEIVIATTDAIEVENVDAKDPRATRFPSSTGKKLHLGGSCLRYYICVISGS